MTGESSPLVESSGARRVAVLLSSLNLEAGRALLRELPAPERQRVLVEVARLELDPPARNEVESTLREFQAMQESARAPGPGGLDVARALVDPEGDPEERRHLLERIEAAVRAAPFGFLAKAGASRIAEALRDEHPQTLALIAACLPPGQAAQMVDRLPLATQAEVVRRLATMEPMSSEAVRRIEKALETKFAGLRQTGAPAPGGLRAAASILARALAETNRQVLDRLEADDPALADRLRDAMLTFDDLRGADDRGLVALVASVDLRRLAVALKSPAPEFAARLFRVLAPAEAALLRLEMQSTAPATLREIADAREEIAAAARRLEKRGELAVRRGTERTS
ncbi:MAG TPA: FliG C-terminal domain-containing protein [Planctomycetota bacterium]